MTPDPLEAWEPWPVAASYSPGPDAQIEIQDAVPVASRSVGFVPPTED